MGLKTKGKDRIVIAKTGTKFDDYYVIDGACIHIIIHYNAPALDECPQKSLSDTTFFLIFFKEDIQGTERLNSTLEHS